MHVLKELQEIDLLVAHKNVTQIETMLLKVLAALCHSLLGLSHYLRS